MRFFCKTARFVINYIAIAIGNECCYKKNPKIYGSGLVRSQAASKEKSYDSERTRYCGGKTLGKILPILY